MLYRFDERDNVRTLFDSYRQMTRAAKHPECVADTKATSEVAATKAMIARHFSGVLPVLFDVAALYFGEPIAKQVCKTYGDGDSAETINPERVVAVAAQFLRLTDPWLLEPRPVAKIAPYNASNQTDARIAALEFAEAARKREQKTRDLHRKLWNAVAPFEGINVYYDLQIGYVPPTLDDWLFSGLTRMTVGYWQAPCPRGLGELETFLKLPVGTARLRKLAARERESKAESWKRFEKFARDQMQATNDDKRREQIWAVLNVVRSKRSVYPYQIDYVFEDQRNRPDDVSLEGFEGLRAAFVSVREDWYTHNRAEAMKLEAAKLTDFTRTEFG